MSRATFPDKGSSPRVRGTLFKDAGCTVGAGIIPACAGNTTVSKTSRRRSGDHPRVCGEHRDQILQNLRDLGSSPRVRGTLLRHEGLKILAGIIPACAGNTNQRFELLNLDKDHPRVCGEHPHKAIADSGFPGSSPRVRGTPAALLGSDQHRGIIPACAGNTEYRDHRQSRRRDHPRVCGEHRRLAAARRSTRGSSPRVRGTRRVHSRPHGADGIIPACAGNTSSPSRVIYQPGDHPRVCGEHSRGGGCGKVAFLIIPACAGNTPHACGDDPMNEDHPRVCGEHHA